MNQLIQIIITARKKGQAATTPNSRSIFRDVQDVDDVIEATLLLFIFLMSSSASSWKHEKNVLLQFRI